MNEQKQKARMKQLVISELSEWPAMPKHEGEDSPGVAQDYKDGSVVTTDAWSEGWEAADEGTEV